jgi:hypothetical protein
MNCVIKKKKKKKNNRHETKRRVALTLCSNLVQIMIRGWSGIIWYRFLFVFVWRKNEEHIETQMFKIC